MCLPLAPYILNAYYLVMTSVYLKTAQEAVKRAEEVILKHFSGSVKYKLKPDQTPVTIADAEAEKVIVKILKSKFPNHGFLGEELGDNNIQAEYVWVIDPIDGTKNYLRGIPLFGTELALIKNGEFIVGVSNSPATGEMIYAEKGKGAYIKGKKIKVSNIDCLEKSYLSFGNTKYFTQDGLGGKLLELSTTTQAFRGFGDFWSYHLLAKGNIDIVMEAKLAIWDVAPFKVIIEEAGGIFTDIKGKEVNINTTSILAANRALHPQMLAKFR